jgi:hypothetical protein
VLDVLRERVDRAEAALDRRELGVGIALEADEEEPGVELARGRFDTVINAASTPSRNPITNVGRRPKPNQIASPSSRPLRARIWSGGPPLLPTLDPLRS